MGNNNTLTVKWFGRCVQLHQEPPPTISYDSPDPLSFIGQDLELMPENRNQTWHGRFSTAIPNAARVEVFARGASPQETVDKLQEILAQLSKKLNTLC